MPANADHATPRPAAPALQRVPQAPSSQTVARAAQQAILLRLAPALRHEMMAHLQAVRLLAETMDARVQRGSLEGPALAAAASSLNRVSREAATACLQVCSWMGAADGERVVLRDVVAEAVRLLSTPLNFRGFELHLEPGGDAVEVARDATRLLVSGALLAVTDAAPETGRVFVRPAASARHGLVTLEVQPGRDVGTPPSCRAGEPPLAWEDLEALAAACGSELQRHAGGLALWLPQVSEA